MKMGAGIDTSPWLTKEHENTFDVIPAKAGIQETKVLDSASSAE